MPHSDFVLDFYEQCRAVNTAFRQSEAHLDHKEHHVCTRACAEIGKKTAGGLGEALSTLSGFYHKALAEGVPEVTLNLVTEKYLPAAVHEIIHQKAA